MAISAPKDPRNIGMVSSQFRDLLSIHMNTYERQAAEAKEKEENMWAALAMMGSGLKMTKNLRDDYISKELSKNVALLGSEKALKLYQRGDAGEGIFNKLKGYVWDAKPETSAELKAWFQEGQGAKSIETPEGRKDTYKILKEKGMKDAEIAKVIGISKEEQFKAVMGERPPMPDVPLSLDDEFLDEDLTVEEVDFDVFKDWEEPIPKVVVEYEAWNKEHPDSPVTFEEFIGRRKVPKEPWLFGPTEEIVEGRLTTEEYENAKTIIDQREEAAGWLAESQKMIGKDVLSEDLNPDQLETLKKTIEQYESVPKDKYDVLSEDLSPEQLETLEKTAEKYKSERIRNQELSDLVNNPFYRDKPMFKDLIDPEREIEEEQVETEDEKAALQEMEAGLPEEEYEQIEYDIPKEGPQYSQEVAESAKKMEAAATQRKFLSGLQDIWGGNKKRGGHLPDRDGKSDAVDITAHEGEYVINAGAAQLIGKDVLDELNGLAGPDSYQYGGEVEEPVAPDTDYIGEAFGVGQEALGAYSGYQALTSPEGGTRSLGAGLGLGSMAASKVGMESLSEATSGGAGILSGVERMSAEEDVLTRAGGAADIAVGTGQIATQVGKKIGSKALEKGGEKAVGAIAGKIAPGIGIISGARDILSEETTTAQKVGGGAQVVGGAATLATSGVLGTAAATAATQFWNPVGWAAGALAVGGTLLSMFGGKGGSGGASRAATIRTGRV